MSRVVWITGLSAAGKTTLATAFAQLLRERGESIVMLDGEDLRYALSETTNFDRDSRLKLGLKFAKLARLIALQGVTVVVATVGLFKEIHSWNRANQPGYLEVYLRVPLQELRRRDPKGMYRRFDNGEINNVAGLDLPVDEPRSPHLLIDFSPDLSPERTLTLLVEQFDEVSLRSPSSFHRRGQI